MSLSPVAIAIAYIFDAALGEPRGFPHPVQAMGRMIYFLEGFFLPRVKRPLAQIAAGAFTVVALVALTYWFAYQIVGVLGSWSPLAGMAANVLILYVTISAKGLADHGLAVWERLARGDLSGAREAVGLIVGRDTQSLNESEISRAAIETVAENYSDGVFAPLLYGFLGGAPLAMAYKAVNTLDSMIGHRSPRYLYFGRVAARLDDAANFLPARLAGVFLALAGSLSGGGSRRAISAMLRDGRNHPSPNSGYCEASMAGLMDVRLGGLNHYDGVPSERPLMWAEGRAPGTPDLERAIIVLRRAGWLGLVFLVAIGVLWAVLF